MPPVRHGRIPSLSLLPVVIWGVSTCASPDRQFGSPTGGGGEAGAGTDAAGGSRPSSGGKSNGGRSGGASNGIGEGGEPGTAGHSSGSASGGSPLDPTGTAGDGGEHPSALSDGLVLHLKMEDSMATDGGILLDSSTTKNDATVHGTVQIAPNGRFGRAALFDGAGWLTIADNNSLDARGALTLSAWVNFSHLAPDYSHGIISKRDAYGYDTAYTMFLWAEDRMWIDIDLESERFKSFVTFGMGRWYHVAVVFDGALSPTERVRFYIDGVLDRVAAEASAEIPAYASDLEIGRLVGGGETMVGMIDEVAIWTRALSDDEIEQLSLDAF